MYDPLPLKSLIEDLDKAQKAAGQDVPYQVTREIILENFVPALTTAFEKVSAEMKGVELLIVQHALANFEFKMTEVLDEREAKIRADNATVHPDDDFEEVSKPQ